MKRLMIWSGSILLLMLLVFIGLLIALPFILDPNDYKEKIEALIYEKSGYQLQIPGDIDLQITPGLDVLFSLGQIQVQAEAEFSGMPLLSSEEVRVEFSLLPLLREKRLVIRGIKLQGVYCNLIRNKAGKGNWEITPAASVTANAPQPKQASSQDISKQKKNNTSSPAFDLGFLDLSKLTVRYEDQQANKRYELKDFSVKTGHVQDGQPFHVQSAFTLICSGKGSAAFSVSSELASDVLLTLASNTVDLNSFVLHSTVSGFGLQETELQLALDTSLDLVRKNALLKTATLSSGLFTGQLEAEVLDFDNPVIRGSLTIPAFSLRQFLADNKWNQPLWLDDSALTDVGFSCSLGGNKKKITISDMAIALDGARGSGSFELLDPEHPSYDVKMHFDRLNLDRYAVHAPTPPPTSPSTPTTATGRVSASSHAASFDEQVPPVPPQALFPVEILRKLNFQLDFASDSMQKNGAKLANVELKAIGNNGQLALEPLRAELYGGSILAKSTLDVSGKVPQLKLQSDLNNVQLEPLLQDMTGKAELTGTAVLSLQIESRGNMKEQFLRHMNGAMSLSFEDGVIKKLHILQVIRQAKALYEGELAVAAAKDEPTGFAHISASGVIRDGVLHNNDLQATSDLMKVRGSGTVDLVKEYVDYLLQISLTRALDRDTKTGKTDFGKYVVPYKIQGHFSELKQEADLAGVLKSQAKNLLVNELQRQLNKNDDRSKSGADKSGTEKLLEKGLKSLFGN
jgi:AsmA protein